MSTKWREVLEHSEWVAIVAGGSEPHVVATWGEYIMRLSPEGGSTVVVPAGYYHRTEEILQSNSQVQIMLASRKVTGTHGPGQGYLLRGRGRVEVEGEFAVKARESFPWARGALVIEVESAQAQL